jgi:hypothetical protein
MFTLLASHALVPRPWLHHAVSWGLHVATAASLYVLLLRRVSNHGWRHADGAAFVLAALFLLHPVTAEAYVWINGRSDLLAGFWLAMPTSPSATGWTLIPMTRCSARMACAGGTQRETSSGPSPWEAHLMSTIRCVPKSGGSSSSGQARPSPVNNGSSCRSPQRPWRVQGHRNRRAHSAWARPFSRRNPGRCRLTPEGPAHTRSGPWLWSRCPRLHSKPRSDPNYTYSIRFRCQRHPNSTMMKRWGDPEEPET